MGLWVRVFHLRQVNSYFTCLFSFLLFYIFFSPFSFTSLQYLFCINFVSLLLILLYRFLPLDLLLPPCWPLHILSSLYPQPLFHPLPVILKWSSGYQWLPEDTFFYSSFLFQALLNFLWVHCSFGFPDPTPTCALVWWGLGRRFLHNTLSNSPDTSRVSENSTQSWHCLSKDSNRLHRWKAKSYKTAL